MENEIILYSTGCPRCTVLKSKLSEKGIAYSEVSSVENMTALGITHVPVLSVYGELYDFKDAVEWINKQ